AETRGRGGFVLLSSVSRTREPRDRWVADWVPAFAGRTRRRCDLRVSASPRELSSPLPRRVALAGRGAFEGDGEFLAQLGEVALDPAFAADQDVVVVGQARLGQRRAEKLAEAALHPVADDRVADLLGDGDAVTLAVPAVGVRQKHETGARDTQAPVGGNEIRALAHDLDRGGRHEVESRRWNGLRPAARKRERASRPMARKPSGRMPAPALEASGLRAELLAATRAAGTEHLAAARSRLAGEETVPAGANEVARLESALHRRKS